MDPEHADLGKFAAVAPIFAMIALILAVIGLYAVMAHSITQRTKEIGVRIAIGAASQDVRRLIFREGMMPVAVGLILGLTGSLAVNRILQSQLIGVSPYDPATLATAPAILILYHGLLALRNPRGENVHHPDLSRARTRQLPQLGRHLANRRLAINRHHSARRSSTTATTRRTRFIGMMNLWAW
jgi:hypothetical protein